MSNKSLEFVNKRILSGICNGFENRKYEHMYEIDFLAIARKINFKECVKVERNLWKTKLFLGENKAIKISIRHNPDAHFEYFSTASCCCDGTFIFFIDLCKKIINKILTGKSCYISKKTGRHRRTSEQV